MSALDTHVSTCIHLRHDRLDCKHFVMTDWIVCTWFMTMEDVVVVIVVAETKIKEEEAKTATVRRKTEKETKDRGWES